MRLRVALAVTTFALAASVASAGGTRAPRLVYASEQTNLELYSVSTRTHAERPLVARYGDDEQAALSPDRRLLAFVSDRDGDDEIYVARADGTHARAVTHNHARDRAPAWSPDGTRLAFASTRTGYGDIYFMDADGTHVRRVTSSPRHDNDPAWSAAGEIAYTSGIEPATVRGVQPDGTRDRELASIGADPAWSPDGRRLAFVRPENAGDLPDESTELVVAEPGAAGTVLYRAPEGYVGVRSPAWASDGRRIAVVAPAGVIAVPLDGGAPEKLTPRHADADPVWLAPERVAFTRRVDGTGLYSRPLAGGEPRVLAHVKAWDLDVSRDGGSIAFAWARGRPTIAIVGTDGGRIRIVGRGRDPSWAPDSRSLAIARRGRILVVDRSGRVVRTLTHGPYDGSPAWRPDGHALAWSRNGSVWTAGADGSSPRRIYRKPRGGYARELAWSAEGRRLAFTLVGPMPTIVVVAASGRVLHEWPKVRSRWPSHPFWTRDGRILVSLGHETLNQFLNESSASAQIYSARPDGSQLRRVTRSDAEDTAPALVYHR